MRGRTPELGRRRLVLEALEERCTPATLGSPWPDARSLTVSFVPDGTPLGPSWTDAAGVVHDPQVSSLFATFSTLPEVQWQREILRGLQTWAVESNINLTLMADSGDPLGTPGLLQGDPRFGDIRIAGGTLSLGTVSAAVPCSVMAGTWSGDLLFNARYPFSVDGSTYDLYSVTLHEAAHLFGLAGNLSTPDSPRYEYYVGPRGALPEAEVQVLQAVLGPRLPDRFEGTGGNTTLSDATSFRLATLAGWDWDEAGNDRLSVEADITTAGDVDTFVYRPLRSGTLTLRLEAQSLLEARVTVLDASGAVIASVCGQGDLELEVPAQAGRRLFFRVEGASDDVFGRGAYRLSTELGSAGCGWDRFRETWQRLIGRRVHDDASDQATRLKVLPALVSGSITRAGEVDYYRFRLGAQQTSLLAGVAGSQTVGLVLLDERGQVLASRQGEPGASLRQEGLSPGKVYYLGVLSGPGATYRLSVTASTASPSLPEVAQGVLNAASPQAFRGMALPAGGVMHFQIGLDASSQPAAATFDLFDQNGTLVYRGSVLAGQTTTWNLLLPAGAYTFRLVGGTSAGDPLADVSFSIGTKLLSDPIGPQLVDPTVLPERLVDPVWFGGGFYVQLGLVDPFGRPVGVIAPPNPIAVPIELFAFGF